MAWAVDDLCHLFFSLPSFAFFHKSLLFKLLLSYLSFLLFLLGFVLAIYPICLGKEKHTRSEHEDKTVEVPGCLTIHKVQQHTVHDFAYHRPLAVKAELLRRSVREVAVLNINEPNQSMHPQQVPEVALLLENELICKVDEKTE